MKPVGVCSTMAPGINVNDFSMMLYYHIGKRMSMFFCYSMNLISRYKSMGWAVFGPVTVINYIVGG
jgi:hypothetical protein